MLAVSIGAVVSGSVGAVSTSVKGRKKDRARKKRKVLSLSLLVHIHRQAAIIEDSWSADLRSVRQDD